MVFDLTREPLHIQDDLGRRILHVLVRVGNSGHRGPEDARDRQSLTAWCTLSAVLRQLGHLDTEGVDHLKEQGQLGKQSFLIARSGTVVLLDALQDSLCDKVFTN